jgi:hypothetical protein
VDAPRWPNGRTTTTKPRTGPYTRSPFAERRTKLLADRDVHANIGFPIRRRADADTHRVPVVRRPVRPVRPPASAPRKAFTPEPVLDKADYEAALKVLQNTRNAFERSPSMTARLTEPHIRDLLLVMVNAQFEGQAAGELFNNKGKTDILIRVNVGNVFIGECKIYGPKTGPKKITETIDQTLRASPSAARPESRRKGKQASRRRVAAERHRVAAEPAPSGSRAGASNEQCRVDLCGPA